MLRYLRPASPSVAGMLRVEDEARLRANYTDHFVIAVVERGAFDGWYRGRVRTHVAGSIKLKEPGEVHRALRVHAPFTMQVALLSPSDVHAAGGRQFRASGFGPGTREARLAFAMHAALVRPDAGELERATLVAETLAELLGTAELPRGSRAVRLARAFLLESLADKITLDAVADHAGVDKFQLVRAFRAEVGLPPYEYLTHARVAKARALLSRGVRVADVAQTVGFCDESQLHRHFRRIVGIAPGQFARSVRQHRPSAPREGLPDSRHG